MISDDKLFLIYILKVGNNYKNDGIYEFIFSQDENEIDELSWGWSETPALNNTQPPEDGYFDAIYQLKTDKIILSVLHDSELFSYIDGYDKIIALAWEDINDEDSPVLTDELPRIVFHYGDTLKDVKENLYTRDLVLKEINVV